MSDEKMLKIPDFSIVLKNKTPSSLYDIVIPVEVKAEKHILAARVQAAGYLMLKLRDMLELTDMNSKIFGFCVGISGIKMSIGYICIENLTLNMSFSHPIELLKDYYLKLPD
jgi:hypothetical protein